MRGHQPPVWKRRSGFFFSLLLGKRAAGRGGKRDGTWDQSHLLLTLDLCALPCHSSWDFQLFHFIYFSSLLPRYFPLLLSCLSRSFICTSRGRAAWRYFKWKCNFKRSCCCSAHSAFGAKDLLLSRQIHTDAAVNLSVLYPSTIRSTGGQEFTAKQRRDRIFFQSQQDEVCIQVRLLTLPPKHRAFCSDTPE